MALRFYPEKGKSCSGISYINLEVLNERAREKLTKMAYDYYKSGAETESTLRDNRAAFARLRLLPRIMIDVSHVDTSCSVMGRRLAYPLLVAPMAMQRMAHNDGELAVVRAAGEAGLGHVQSTMGTVSLENVAAAGKGAGTPLLIFQLYVLSDRELTRSLVQRAERSGYQAVMVTVDAPLLGKREADELNGFELPVGLTLSNLEGLDKADADVAAPHPGSSLARAFERRIDASLTWEFVAWLRSATRLPIFVKGVLAPADAEQAVNAGVDGIVVSNHGGRQADYALASLDALPAVAAAVAGRVPVLMDGGVRRGTDIIKALALGADAVLLGRPVLWGLALDGQAGVAAVLETLRRELALNLALNGCARIGDVTRAHLLAPGEVPARL